MTTVKHATSPKAGDELIARAFLYSVEHDCSLVEAQRSILESDPELAQRVASEPLGEELPKLYDQLRQIGGDELDRATREYMQRTGERDYRVALRAVMSDPRNRIALDAYNDNRC
jgi:hypothetical protein